MSLDKLKYKSIFGKQDPEYKIAVGLLSSQVSIEDAFKVNSDIGLYDDGAPNALALPERVSAWDDVADGVVLIGRQLIAAEQRQSPEYWGTSVTAITAHEYAHL